MPDFTYHECDGTEDCNHILCNSCYPQTGNVVELDPDETYYPATNGDDSEANQLPSEQMVEVTFSIQNAEEEEISRRCGHCGEISSKKCEGCEKVYYCNSVCQRRHWRSGHRDVCQRIDTNRRKVFHTPCGQTYWYDTEMYIYTNQRVELPIGYWCKENQTIYLNEDNTHSSDDEDEDEDEYVPPPTPPPLYVEESNSVLG